MRPNRNQIRCALAAALAAACGCTDPFKEPPKPAAEYSRDGDQYYIGGDFYRAMNQYGQAINRDSDYAPGWAGLGDVHRELAVIEFQKIPSLHQIQEKQAKGEPVNPAPTVVPNDHLTRSRWAFEEALRRDAGMTRALYGLGKLYYEKAVRLADAPVWKDQGRAYATPDDRKAWAEKSVGHLTRALSSSRKDDEFYRWSHRYLGILYTLLGRRDDARAAFATFQQFSRETLEFLKSRIPQDDKERIELDTRRMILEKDVEEVDALIIDLERQAGPGSKSQVPSSK